MSKADDGNVFERLIAPITELRFLPNGDEGTVEGYGSTFNVEPDGVNSVILPGAYTPALAEHAKRGTAPAMLWNHDKGRPVGRWEAVNQDSKGLHVRGRFNMATSAGKMAREHVKHGDVTGLSVGIRFRKSDTSSRGDHYAIHQVAHLDEISLCTTPANPDARISQCRTLSSRGELEELLLSTGLSRGAARKLAAGGFPALAGREADAIDPAIIRSFRDEVRSASADLASIVASASPIRRTLLKSKG